MRRSWPATRGRRLAAALLLGLLLVSAGAVQAARWAISWAPQGSALDHDELPFYARADLLPRWDGWSRGHNVGAVELVGADGGPFDERVFAAGPTVVSFFWTGCDSVCPLSIDLLRGMKGARVLLVSDQPLVDTPGLLRAYAARRSLPPQWRLATGKPDEITGWAKRALFLDLDRLAPDGGPLHAEINYLIDRQGRLRGIYAANSRLDAARLVGDYARLQAEARGGT